MKAMVLAAGVGSRMGALTKDRPKALLEVGGVPMLGGVLMRLKAAGVTEAVVNAHHHAAQIESFIKENDFGLRLEVSREDVLLDTGGGLKKAAWFFEDGEPFFLHNADVVSEVDLARLYAEHLKSGALATLSVRKRESGRYFLFGKDGRLKGHQSAERKAWAGAADPTAEPLAFDGIHAISPAIFQKMTEDGIFSINAVYLRLAGLGERIQAFRADEYEWRDVGNADKLERARKAR